MMNCSTAICLQNVCKQYGATTAMDQVSFDIAPGEFVALLGPSGCGKTTTLRVIAGLEQLQSGELWLGGRRVAGDGDYVPPDARRVGMVFQDGALFPHLTLAQNIAFPLSGKLRARETATRVDELLKIVGLPGMGERFPHQISGGQQQRIALARALAADPQLVLLDEPFSRLDAGLRVALREEVHAIIKQRGATALFVTHDQEEALSIADRIVVMIGGKVIQVGTPHEVYARPATRQLATFVGEANFVPGVASAQSADSPLGRLLLNAPHEGNVELMIRPEAIEIETDRGDGIARIERIRYFGHDQTSHLLLRDGTPLIVRSLPRPDLEVGSLVDLSIRGVVVAYPAESSH